MTAITVTEWAQEPIVCNLGSGTPKRRSKLYFRFTAATADETLDLTSLDPTIADIEGVVYATDDGAVAGTAPTWSTYTFTGKTAGTEEVCLVVTHT